MQIESIDINMSLSNGSPLKGNQRIVNTINPNSVGTPRRISTEKRSSLTPSLHKRIKKYLPEYLDMSMNVEQSTTKDDAVINQLPIQSNAQPNMKIEELLRGEPNYFCEGSHSNIYYSSFLEVKSGEATSAGGKANSNICSANGHGGISNLLHCFSRQTHSKGVPVILKRMKESSAENTQANREFKREVNYLLRLSHSNIVTFLGFGIERVDTNLKVPFLVVERLLGGTLSEIFNTPRPHWSRPFSHMNLLRHCVELASALKHLHFGLSNEVTVIHRDLKPDNIGFTGKGVLKLFDFGLCVGVKKKDAINATYQLTPCTGSLRYMAKEVAVGESYNHKADMYSFGMTLYEMATGVPPFFGYGKFEFQKKVIENNDRPPTKSDMHSRKIKVGKEYIALVEQCWDVDPTRRPTSFEAFDILTNLYAQSQESTKSFKGATKTMLRNAGRY